MMIQKYPGPSYRCTFHFRPRTARQIVTDSQLCYSRHAKNALEEPDLNNFVTSDPHLYIIAAMPRSFELVDLPWCEAAAKKIMINSAKFENLEMVEVIIDAMPFLLSRLTPIETKQLMRSLGDQAHITDTLSPHASAIGVALTENLSSAQHLPDIHQRLLLLGEWIGQSLNASMAVWIPSQKIMSFTEFRGMIVQYRDQDPALDAHP